jgi:hypothetical protein
MSGGMSMFQSELRSAVRDAREASGTEAGPELSVSSAGPARARVQPRRRTHAGRRTVVRLWLPLTPLWVILSPFALLLAPLVMLAPRLIPNRPGARAVRAAMAVRPYPTAFAIGTALFALSGTVVEVDTPDALVRIRIF